MLLALALAGCSSDSSAPSAPDAEPDANAETSTDAATPDASDAPDAHSPTPPDVDPPDQLGPYAVGHTSYTATDPQRDDRQIKVDVWYPVTPGDEADADRTEYPLAGPLGLPSPLAWEDAPVAARPDQPLLVFSHGYGGINTQSTELMEALASHGFVVAAPEHTGNAQGSLTDPYDVAASNRVPDVSFVIDELLARNAAPDDPFSNRVDPTLIGVVGHSFGGMTSIGAAAGWAGASADPRVRAIAPISAVIDGDLQEDLRTGPNAGFTPDDLARVEVPVLLLGGTEDVDVPIGNNALAFDQLVNAPTVYRVDIIGANHTHFAGVCAIGDFLIDNGLTQDLWASIGAEALIAPYNATCSDDAFPIEDASRLQNLFVIAFFRAHLLGQADYTFWLTPSYAEGEPDAELSLRSAR